MSVLDVKGLTCTVRNKVLYNNASFSLNKEDHLGITGANGVGKTTLINCLVGKTEIDTGDIIWQKGIKIGYLDQHADVPKDISIFTFLREAFKDMFEKEKELNTIYEKMAEAFDDDLAAKADDLQNFLMYRGFYDIDGKIQKTAQGLGINAFGLEKQLSNLSGGQKAKVILAKLLLESPDVIIMDEPTNFLDKEHIDWLTKVLINFEGAFIVISHDFKFLNDITNCIIDIEFQKITKYTGNFQQFLKLKDEAKTNYIKEYEKQQKTIAQLQDYYNKNHARASTARSAQSKLKQLEKIDVMNPPKALPPPTFSLTSLQIGYGVTLEVNELVVGYSHGLLPPLNFIVNAKEKIVIVGFNGIGKSTLIKTITGSIPQVSGSYKWTDTAKIAYLEQELIWDDPTKNAFEILKDKFPVFDDNAVRKNLAKFGITGKISMQAIHSLSGGEQMRVKLCILMLTPANVLILDEPTNHIDVNCKEVLKEQLMKWDGSLILVSHEHEFYKGWIDKIIEVKKK